MNQTMIRLRTIQMPWPLAAAVATVTALLVPCLLVAACGHSAAPAASSPKLLPPGTGRPAAQAGPAA